MIEISPANAAAYLRAQGWVGPGPVDVEVLSGGVSNLVMRVSTPEHPFVLKQSRPQLRTEAAWFSDIDRIYREQEIMEALHPLLPGTVPAVLFHDRDNYVFAMSHAPAEARVWKECLLTGDVDDTIGTEAGRVLGRMHQASSQDATLAERFEDLTIFEQLRIAPFYETVQRNRPEVAERIEPIIARLRTTKEAICHGDYTPKNILTHEHGFTLVDYETAHFGDPTMDIGLFLAHLVLKAFRRPADRAAFFHLIQAFWLGYAAEVRFRPIANLEERGIEHLAVCLLARIDGTSPVNYLPEARQQEAVRQLAVTLLAERSLGWRDVESFSEDVLATLE